MILVKNVDSFFHDLPFHIEQTMQWKTKSMYYVTNSDFLSPHSPSPRHSTLVSHSVVVMLMFQSNIHVQYLQKSFFKLDLYAFGFRETYLDS
jgi:hypothetical protein